MLIEGENLKKTIENLKKAVESGAFECYTLYIVKEIVAGIFQNIE